jgi:hypothetical protein
MRTLLPVTLLFACLLTGCAFKRVVEVPGASGRVVDASTSQPVAGVAVTRHAVKWKTVLSDTDGRFSVKPVAGLRCHTIFPPAFVGPYHVTGNVEFIAPGYETRVITNRAMFLDFEPLDLATIELRQVKNERSNHALPWPGR